MSENENIPKAGKRNQYLIPDSTQGFHRLKKNKNLKLQIKTKINNPGEGVLF